MSLLIAGLPEAVASRCAELLPGASVERAGSGAALMEALGSGPWGVVMIDSGLPDLPAPQRLREALNAGAGPRPCVIFASRLRLDAETAHLLVDVVGVDHLLYHPLDPQEIARIAAPRLRAAQGAAAPEPDRRAELSAAMGGLWERFRGTIFARLEVLEEAAIGVLEGPLDEDLRQRATREAHKLAGAVGTFGFSEGSRIAREIEGVLEGSAPLEPAQALLLSERVVALRAELEAPPAQEAAPPAPVAGEGLSRLLIVDDDRELAERLAMEAAGQQMRVEVVPGVQEARGAVRRDRPDIVLLDLSFGDDTHAGLELLGELSAATPPVPVVVLTARNSFDDRVEVARRGGRGFLRKPVTPSRVIEVVRETLERRQLSGNTVLAVDDDPQILEAVRVLLEARGFDVVTLDDPLRFWDVLEKTSPDLLVLDVDMPHLTGLELCRVVRNDPQCSALPIVFLTARTDPETVHRVFAAGADDYVSKPFVGPELVTRLTNRLERVHLHRAMAESDPLTGIANRRKSEEVIAYFLLLAAREERSFSLAVIDLDHFKAVNDRHGHPTGDQVLQRFAKLLLRAFRAEDVVARWGGEEFVVGMFGMEKSDGVARLNAVLARVGAEEFTSPHGEPFRVTFSAGIAEFPRDGTELPSLYRAADEALYAAKSEGRNRVLAAGWGPGEGPETEMVDVLLVDDDTVLAGLLLHALETRGYRTHWIQDGEAAVEALSGARPKLRARVILLDVDLPGLDGLGVLRALGREHVLLRSRVIMLTARAGETEVLKALDLGATDHVGKPFSVPVLLQRVRRALDGERAP